MIQTTNYPPWPPPPAPGAVTSAAAGLPGTPIDPRRLATTQQANELFADVKPCYTDGETLLLTNPDNGDVPGFGPVTWTEGPDQPLNRNEWFVIASKPGLNDRLLNVGEEIALANATPGPGKWVALPQQPSSNPAVPPAVHAIQWVPA